MTARSRLRLVRALLLASIPLALMFLPNPDRAGAETPLVVLLTKSATSDNYPVINAELSVVDRSSGRPVARLDAPSMVISDESGRLALLGLNAANSEKAPVAYSILLDTGGAMAPYLGKATELLKAVVAQLLSTITAS